MPSSVTHGIRPGTHMTSMIDALEAARERRMQELKEQLGAAKARGRPVLDADDMPYSEDQVHARRAVALAALDSPRPASGVSSGR